MKDSRYLIKTVSKYIEKYSKKIVVLPSSFARSKSRNKRSQFITYGQSKIRNRVTQFLQNQTFIASSMDEVIYKKSYKYTEKQLREFEKLTDERADKGLSTVGFIPLLCVWPDGIYPCNGIPISRLKRPDWRHRLFRFVLPFQRKKSKVHNTTYQVLKKGKWVNVTPSSSLPSEKSVKKYKNAFPLNLSLMHYHTLVHPKFNSAKYVIPPRDSIKKREAHPKFYLNKLKFPREHPRVQYWRQVVKKNRKYKRDWFHGLPYNWWYGLSGVEFLRRLPQHLDKKREPKWFSDVK